MRRLPLLLFAGWAAVTAGCSSLVHTVLFGPADLDERRRAAEVREKEEAAKSVLHWTDAPTDPADRYQVRQSEKRR